MDAAVIVATTRGRVVRATTIDALGDEIDDNTADPVSGSTDFPLSIIERDRSEMDPATGTWRAVRKLTGRVPANVNVEAGDRILDLASGLTYTVDGKTSARRGLAGRSSATLSLRRTGL